MQVHVFDWRWFTEHTAQIQAVAQNKFGRKTVQKGDQISIAPVGKKTCAGAYINESWQPCGSAMAEKKAKCALCRSKEGSFIYTAFDGFDTSQIGPSDLEKLQSPHVIYFAYFSPEVMKVGVSNKKRDRMRQIEQGSHATLYIAETPDGIIARQMETLIRRGGVNDKVLLSQKKKNISPDVSSEQIKKQLLELMKTAKKSIGEMPQLLEYMATEPTFMNWQEHHGLPSGSIHVANLNVGESISGKIIGLKGPFIFIDTGQENICVCMKDLVGMTVDFTPLPVGIKTETAFQGALF